MNKLVVNLQTREKRYALIQNGQVEKLVIHQPHMQSLVGNLYVGIVTKVIPGMNAAFVHIGEEKNGYLQRDALPSYIQSSLPEAEKRELSISKLVHQGEKIIVQVEKDPVGVKGPKVTALIELSGPSLIYLPHGRYIAVSKKIQSENEREKWREFGDSITTEEEGLIFRTSSVNKTEAELKEELEQLREQYQTIKSQAQNVKAPALLKEEDPFISELLEEIKRMNGEVFIDNLQLHKLVSDQFPQWQSHFHQLKTNIFADHNLDSELDKASRRVVWLDNGAYLIIDHTEACTVIDVNSGRFTGKQNLEDTILKTNEQAAEEIARHIRLRNISGMILIDFIDMKKQAHRDQIVSRIEKVLRKDERRTRIVGFTPLGILELTRKKTRPALHETLSVQCPVCKGKGHIDSAETVAFRLERELWEYKGTDADEVYIEATEHVINAFSGDEQKHIKRIEETLHFKINFTPINDLHHYYRITKWTTFNS